MGISSTDRAVSLGYLLELTRYITQETSIAPRAMVWVSGKVTCLCVFRGSLITHQLSQTAVGWPVLCARPHITAHCFASAARAGCHYIIL